MKTFLKYFITTLSLTGIALFVFDLASFDSVAIMGGPAAMVGATLAFTGGLMAIGFNSVWSKWTDDVGWD